MFGPDPNPFTGPSMIPALVAGLPQLPRAESSRCLYPISKPYIICLHLDTTEAGKVCSGFYFGEMQTQKVDHSSNTGEVFKY